MAAKKATQDRKRRACGELRALAQEVGVETPTKFADVGKAVFDQAGTFRHVVVQLGQKQQTA